MFKCKFCPRTFKTMQSLGGHVKQTHPSAIINSTDVPYEETPDDGASGSQELVEAKAQNENSIKNGGNKPGTELVETQSQTEQAETVANAEQPEDQSKAAEIREYIENGYSFEQLVKDLHLEERSVRREWSKKITPTAVTVAEDDHQLPVTIKGTEVITPESILQRLQDGSHEWALRFEGMMLLRAAQKMNREDIEMVKLLAEADSKRLDPILKMLTVSREELDAAAARAKESSGDIARTAARETAGGLLGWMEERFPKTAAVPPPKTEDEMWTKRMDRMFDMMQNMMEQKMFPQAVNQPPEGWDYKQESTNNAPAAGAAKTSSQGTVPGWEEKKEVENDQSGDVRQSAGVGAGEGGRETPENGDKEVPQAG